MTLERGRSMPGRPYARRVRRVVGTSGFSYKEWKGRFYLEDLPASGMLRYYAETWRKDGAVLVGYSMGADVLPFMVNRLPAESRSRVRAIALISPSQEVDFEFHFEDWLGGVDRRRLSRQKRSGREEERYTKWSDGCFHYECTCFL